MVAGITAVAQEHSLIVIAFVALFADLLQVSIHSTSMGSPQLHRPAFPSSGHVGVAIVALEGGVAPCTNQ